MGKLRQLGAAHQVAVNLPGGFASFVDGAYHQRLTPAAIARGKYIVYAGFIVTVLRLVIGAFVVFQVERVADIMFRA